MKKNLLKKLADLAKLNLSKKELEKYTKDISGILDYVKQLEEIDASKVEPMAHAVGIGNVMREDKIDPSESNIKTGEYFKTKAIF